MFQDLRQVKQTMYFSSVLVNSLTIWPAAPQQEHFNPLFLYDKGYYTFLAQAHAQSILMKLGVDSMPLGVTQKPYFHLPFHIMPPTENWRCLSLCSLSDVPHLKSDSSLCPVSSLPLDSIYRAHTDDHHHQSLFFMPYCILGELT